MYNSESNLMGRELNARQSAFVREYAKSGNGTQAATLAGYSAKTADVIGSRLLRKPQVILGLQQVLNRSDVTVARVLKEYSRLAFLNPQSFYDKDGRMLSIAEMPEDSARAIAGIEEEVIYGPDGKADIGRLKKIKLTGKIPALEGLARHLGMFQAENPGLQQAFAITIHVGKEE